MNKNAKKCRVYLGADHDGFKLKEYFKKYLSDCGYAVKDMGNKYFDPKDDYPDFGKKVARGVLKEKNSRGLLFCDSGQGMCMVANRFPRVRASLGWSQAATKRARHDDDSNIICLPGWLLNHEQAKRIINAFLKTEFSKLPRHQRRIRKIS